MERNRIIKRIDAIKKLTPSEIRKRLRTVFTGTIKNTEYIDNTVIRMLKIRKNVQSFIFIYVSFYTNCRL